MLGLEAWLSLIGPAYFAYYGFTIPVMVVWAILCATLWVWNNRPSKRQTAQDGSAARSRFASLMFFVVVAACYVAAHTAVYLVVRHLARLWA
jgi:fucose permease